MSNRPAPVKIKLTRAQMAQLREHFAHVAAEHERGKTGILAAQVWAPRTNSEYPHGYINVGFVPHAKAKIIQGCAK